MAQQGAGFMSRWRIPSPWPQWRSHWHAWHAWPAGAQALVCVSLSVLACAWGSSQWSGDMWLAWWEYPQAHEALAADIQTLRRQLEQHQERVHALSTMPHPSGLAMPAWQAWPELSTANTATGLPLSYLPGLQPSNGPDHLKWRGNLAQLLAAWQQLPQAYPTQRIKAFELQTLPETDPDAGKPTQPQLQLEISWGQPPPQSANGIRPTEASSAMTHDPTALASGPPAQVWHNPFAVQGLRQSLPPQVQTGTA
ncbi:MAG: hypothetical protein EBZ60_03850 [Betaproteobacteria bacterium]|nr:hypothetical protein [Betaproteobacteria bacterium]